MLTQRRKFAIMTVKILSWIIQKLLHRRGSTFPGYAAQLISPDILPWLAGMMRGKIIVTMGTNGKTTVNSLMCHMLQSEGKQVIANHTGANMLNGVVTAFVLAADKRGIVSADYACIEVDEFASTQILPLLKPGYILLTNIFRDQTDRYGDVDTVCDRISRAVSYVPHAQLIINGDDVLSCSLASRCSVSVTTYGINEHIFDPVSGPEVRESIFCPSCGGKLHYLFFHYGQLGIYHCPHCGWKRPSPDFTAEKIACRDHRYVFDMDGTHIDSQAEAPYSIYNTLSAYAALKTADVPLRNLKSAIEAFDYRNHREEIFSICGARVQLHLAKNPVGFQQKLALILKDHKPKDIIIQINDARQDGEDISWLWDVDFKYLKNTDTGTIFAAGSRRIDMALRLKYEDISCDLSSNILGVMRELCEKGTKNLYIIVNYSGLFHTNRMLHRLQEGTL